MAIDVTTSTLAHPVLELERSAMHRWLEGDPDGFLEISAPDVVYFDPTLPARLDGLEALTGLYSQLRGQVHAARFAFVEPRVQEHGELAVLTFNFVSWDSTDTPLRWNCTEVYRRTATSWEIIQTHWSFTQTVGGPGEDD
ncbi:YybH family protein [Cellulomonas soli]|uniref:YybH family protein n=1 Tax=Cellulomonas soli TaxID=931535 RepID=UPI003F87D4FC